MSKESRDKSSGNVNAASSADSPGIAALASLASSSSSSTSRPKFKPKIPSRRSKQPSTGPALATLKAAPSRQRKPQPNAVKKENETSSTAEGAAAVPSNMGSTASSAPSKAQPRQPASSSSSAAGTGTRRKSAVTAIGSASSVAMTHDAFEDGSDSDGEGMILEDVGNELPSVLLPVSSVAPGPDALLDPFISRTADDTSATIADTNQQTQGAAIQSNVSVAKLLQDQGSLVFMQLPSTLPLSSEYVSTDVDMRDVVSIGNDTSMSEQDRLARQLDSTVAHRLDKVPDGEIGKMRVWNSGKVTMVIGGIEFEVEKGSDAQFLQEFGVIDESSGSLNMLGEPSGKVILSAMAMDDDD